MPLYFAAFDADARLVIIRKDENQITSFSENPDNADWRAYEEWLAEGNTPEPWPPAE